jgi:hypothetical protein
VIITKDEINRSSSYEVELGTNLLVSNGGEVKK